MAQREARKTLRLGCLARAVHYLVILFSTCLDFYLLSRVHQVIDNVAVLVFCSESLILPDNHTATLDRTGDQSE